MINAKEKVKAVLYDGKDKHWLQFSNPLTILSAYDLGAVASVLDAVEDEINNHHYAVGFVAYEAAPAFDNALTVNTPGKFPLAWFAIYAGADRIPFPQSSRPPPAPLQWQLSVHEDEYHSAIRQVKNFIHQGDTYQVNYSFRMRSPYNDDPWLLFENMINAQGYGYGAFIDTGDWCVCSASHELFFRLENNMLESKPMKGTVPRGLHKIDDAKQADWLKHSIKNRAENLMIVDMVRNDMGHIAITGSVKTVSLFDTERYPTLWQMTSTVQSETDAGIGEIFRALFPAASITGAPKARTMEIIRDLEESPRRIYTGSIGFITPGRRAQFNVAIRTVLIDRLAGVAEYGVGGGIVWDSETENELEECHTKAMILTRPPQDFELLETMTWTAEEGFLLLQYHLERLADSAEYFFRQVDMKLIQDELDKSVIGLHTGRYRIRLRVPGNGKPLVETSPLNPSPGKYRLHLARRPVDSKNDPFLYHKTTRRGIYDQQLNEFPDYDDVLLFNKNNQVTESCIANVAVELKGEKITPPVSCGLLPGTYRRYLLERGEIKEGVIDLEDLKSCSGIFLLNSVRGMWEVTLDD